MKIVIDHALDYVKRVFESDFSGHDYFHTFRVYQLATQIAEKENANLEIVQLAALLHDVDDIKLSPETHRNKAKAKMFLLENDVDEAIINTICQILDEVSYKGSDSLIPTTREGKCVQDADRLDAIGAIVIARAFAYGGNHHRVMHDPSISPMLNMNEEEYRNHIPTTINHFYEKLFNLKKLMNTETTRKIADSREMYMKEYICRFMDEWEGIR